MKARIAQRTVPFLILAAGVAIGLWAAAMFGSGAAMLIMAALVTLPFGLLALIARFMASAWFSQILVILAASGAAWISIKAYPASRGDAQGALVFVFLPIYLCFGGGITAVLVLLSELIVRARARLALTRGGTGIENAARQASAARWTIAISASLFVVIAGACLQKITLWVLRDHELNAARNLSSPEDRLRTLEKALLKKDYEILGILAYQDLPGEDLRRIHASSLQSPNAGSTAMYNLASNPKTPPDLLTSLADDNPYVARSVAQNPSAPSAILEKLAAHEDEHVRWAVAVNPSTPLELLPVLKDDAEDKVRRAALRSLNKGKAKGKSGKKKAARTGHHE